MGAWSTTAFGNDSALDWLGDLYERHPVDWPAVLEAVLHRFREFEQARASGKNKRVRTAERAEYMINLARPPLTGDLADMIRRGIGKEYEYVGDDETFQLIAAAAVLSTAVTGDRSELPPDMADISFEGLDPGIELLGAYTAALRDVPSNKTLCRDCGPKWKKDVLALADRLEGFIG